MTTARGNLADGRLSDARLSDGPLEVSGGFPSPIPSTADRPPSGIEICRLSHRYRGQAGGWVQALEAIDLDIAAGAFVAILGPSGCGKTTLLRILSGLLEPTGGEVRLADGSSAAARRRRAIGWLAQEDGLLPWRTVGDNVWLPLGLARAARTGAEIELLRRVGLAGQARQYPHELSGGMRQRVALARALVARPPFLLLDEPFAHLDELTRERLGDMLLQLRSEGAVLPTTVLVTHSVAEAVRLADRIVVLSPRPGRVVADLEVGLRHPRHEEQPGFGGLVRELKATLMAAHDITPPSQGSLPRAATRSCGPAPRSEAQRGPRHFVTLP